ncbi:hypothetical protein OQA88_5366 [Cercophora sp. LCS_1]
MPTLSDFIRAQFLLKIPVPTASFASKTVIITGANGGLGKETAQHIVRLGASKVILACRSHTKGTTTKREIETTLKCSPEILEVWELDIESPESVRAFVDKANSLGRLDVVINNAGIHTMSGFQLAYGTERALAVNTIGTFLLAFQLIQKLKETAEKFGVTPHMTTVSSALYEDAKFPDTRGEDLFAWFADEKHVDKVNQYNLSKLLQIFTIIRLSALVDTPGTTNPHTLVINSLDPCFCKTGLGSDLTGPLKFFMKVFQAITARTAEEGSRLVVQAASAGRVTHGKYMRCGEVREYHSIAMDARKTDEVWDSLCRRLEERQPGVLMNLKG